MKPILFDYEIFKPAFYDVSIGIRRLVVLKLNYLRERKWMFKGWVRNPQNDEIEFELRYNDNKTEENYILQGICCVNGEFKLKSVNVNFDVIEEPTQKAVSFEMQIDGERELEEIEEAIKSVLKNNRSYRYFRDDYNRYMRNDPIQYVKSIIENQLIAMEEEIYDEGIGVTYRYTGEFGEDYLEIIIDDSEIIDEEDMGVFDIISINVCDRFYFNYSEPNCREIRSLLPLLRTTVIPINDFLIRTNNQKCLNKDHQLHRIQALVCVDSGSVMQEVKTEAMYCEECNLYFISEIEYEKLCRKGRICSRVITYTEYLRIVETGYHSWAEKSLLRSYGYNVAAQEGLTDNERQRILSFVLENGIMKAEEVIFFIEWLIKKNSSDKYFNARQKWSRDIIYVRNYKQIDGVVRVRDIYRKKYIREV